MLKVAELRLRLHDLVCMSGCADPVTDNWFPDDWTAEQRQEYVQRRAEIRVEHARSLARYATAFRKPDADRLQVLHDAVCRAGAECPQGKTHMSERARALVVEWAGDAEEAKTDE